MTEELSCDVPPCLFLLSSLGQSASREADALPFYLRDYLRQHGVPQAFDGWIKTGFVTGVSPDGHVVVGFGAGPTDFQGYIVILPKEPPSHGGSTTQIRLFQRPQAETQQVQALFQQEQ